MKHQSHLKVGPVYNPVCILKRPTSKLKSKKLNFTIYLSMLEPVLLDHKGDWKEGGFLQGPRGICCIDDTILICDLNNYKVRGTSAHNFDEVWNEIGCDVEGGP